MEPIKEEPAPYGAVNFDRWGKPRVGDWIQTRSGGKFHLLDPRPEDFVIEDIAHALSHACRFAGHVRKFYSVAEHSVRVAEEVARSWSEKWSISSSLLQRDSDVYAGLMHDASEAYLTDIPRPFKHLPEFAFYREIEDKVMSQIANRFWFFYPLEKSVKRADEILLGTEARDLMAPTPEDWHVRYPQLPGKIRPWSPAKAKRRFLDLFYCLNPLGIEKPRRRLVSWIWQPIVSAVRIDLSSRAAGCATP